MIENRNVNIITDTDGKKLVLINDIRFKGKRQINWDDVKQYLEGYVGDYYEIAENAERIFIGSELPEEYTESESWKSLMGANTIKMLNSVGIGMMSVLHSRSTKKMYSSDTTFSTPGFWSTTPKIARNICMTFWQ